MTQDTKTALRRFPKFALLEGCTPIQRLSRLEAMLGEPTGGARLWVKRDDLMGLGGGGNKLRKLEYLVGEAVDQGCDTFITTGGLQSNHARQSAAAAARAGLACELMLADVVPLHDADYRSNGNLLLDDIFGATVHRLPTGADVLSAAHARADELRQQQRRAYIVGSGGSSPRGALGYAACAAEILDQERTLGLRFETIVVPNGSSGTHAGLAAGMATSGETAARIQSFTVLAPVDEALASTERLAAETVALLDPDMKFPAGSIIVHGDQRGEAYGLPTDAMVTALRLLARSEGLLLDPVYSGKAFAGFLDRANSGIWAERDVLFVMTGGTPGLFAYRETLSER